MDPNANLAEQQRLLRDTIPAHRFKGVRGLTAARRRLSELRAALTAWLSAGGFEPTWSAAPDAAAYYAFRYPNADAAYTAAAAARAATPSPDPQP